MPIAAINIRDFGPDRAKSQSYISIAGMKKLTWTAFSAR